VYSSRGSSEFVVEPGSPVRERQEILRLPDPKQMQVTAKITESQVNLLKEGMSASIRVEALGDEELEGRVVKVNEYAEPSSFWSSSSKEYKTIIQITDPPPYIRSGLTAEIRIRVEQRADALQIPVQAILEKNDRTFCLVRKGDEYETREVRFSSTNDKVVALEESEDGLVQGEQIVLDPRQHVEKFDFSSFGLELSEPEVEVARQTPATGTLDSGKVSAPSAANGQEKSANSPTTSPGGEDAAA
jgi:hypothetical protein